MSRKYLFCLLLLSAVITASAQVKTVYTVYSPDKLTAFETGLTDSQHMQYRLRLNGQVVIPWSPLGILVDGMAAGERLIIKNSMQTSHHEKFAWRLGEDDTITNNYNQVVSTCLSGGLPLTFTVRVFNGSVAFRYGLPHKADAVYTISGERTAFNFTGPYVLYQYNQESVFTPVAIDTFNNTCDLPATLTNGKFFISIGEADNQTYTKTELKRSDSKYSLAPVFVRDSAVKMGGTFETPWRTISIATTAIGLHAFSELYLKLVPAASALPAWITPGKLIRAQLNTRSGLDCIDFAEKHHFQYIMFDAGWYGDQYRTVSDPTQVIPEIDMPRVIAYGKEKNVGVILYVNYVGLRAKLDTILPVFKKWGVRGIKFGFVDGITQKGISWLTAAIKKVNDAGFILDVHDNYKPTGLSRAYPALLTQEGIRGDENSPDAFHTTVLPFTRFLAGAADFTFCYPNSTNSYSKNLKVTKAQQLALTVAYFSPLQSMFWYGQPKEYTNEDEIEFFSSVPTVWNESHYLLGEIGRFICVARRSGTNWYVGSAAGLQDWDAHLPLDFLTPGKMYTAVIYEDGERGSLVKRTITVKKGDVFPISIKAKGGQAMIITSTTGSSRLPQ